MNIKNIGIMGGTFNPIHYAHLILANTALYEFNLDEIWFIPSKNPPHKSTLELISDEHRLNMIKLAISDNKNFSVSDIELKRDGKTYTVDTLNALSKIYPEYKFSFILGGDSLRSFVNWYKPDEICKLATILAANREDMDKVFVSNSCEEIRNRFNANIEYFEIPSLKISSTLIRENIKQNKPIKYLLPESVIEYILKNNLYTS